MIIKVRFDGDNHIIANLDNVAVLPNLFGGTRQISMTRTDTVWLANNHFDVDGPIKFQSAQVQALETRSSLDEDDEEWNEVYRRIDPWSYERDRTVEAIIEELINAN